MTFCAEYMISRGKNCSWQGRNCAQRRRALETDQTKLGHTTSHRFEIYSVKSVHHYSFIFDIAAVGCFSSSAFCYYIIHELSQPIHLFNFLSQDRVTDHRVGLNVSSVERVLNAESLDPIIDALTVADERERLEYFLDSLDQKRKDAEMIKKK
jgi:hypothetical protein